MTEDVRPGNWVRARANCTIKDNFETLLKEVKQDVVRFNSLSPEKRGDKLFLCKQREDGFAIYQAQNVYTNGKEESVIHGDYVDDFVLIHHTTASIIASRQKRVIVEIQPSWNETTLTCDLCIEQQAYPLWQMSQKVIGGFLFEDL